jgi:hypothetical protein
MIFSGNYSGAASGAQAYADASVQLSTITGTISAGPCATGYTSTTCSSSFSAPFLYDSANGFSVYSSPVACVTGFTCNSNEVTVDVEGATDSAGQFNAQIDPTFQIDPTWLATHPGYSLVFGANVSAVPVPASAWLMLSALGALGLVMRRKGGAWR